MRNVEFKPHKEKGNDKETPKIVFKEEEWPRVTKKLQRLRNF